MSCRTWSAEVHALLVFQMYETSKMRDMGIDLYNLIFDIFREIKSQWPGFVGMTRSVKMHALMAFQLPLAYEMQDRRLTSKTEFVVIFVKVGHSSLVLWEMS